MGTRLISVEPFYLYDPKKELSIRIDKHLSKTQRQRKVLQKLKAQSALRRYKKQGIRFKRCSAQKSSIFLDGNFSSDAVIPFIDIVMKLQQNAYEASIETNRGYELQLLLIFLEAFISIVFNFYYMISVLAEPKAFKLSRKDTISYLSQHLIEPIICILVIVYSFSLLKCQFRKSQQIVNKIIIHSKDNEVRTRFLAFSQQLQTNIPQFSVFEFFALDGSVVFAMISATTTYLIILVQALGGESEVDPFYSAYEGGMNKSSVN